MKLKNYAILCLGATVASAPAVANPAFDFFAGATIGTGAYTVFTKNHNKTESAQSVGGLIGIDMPFFRIDTEYNYLHSTGAHANIAMLNAYFKVPMNVINPYIGAGVGMIFNGYYEKFNKDINLDLGYQGMLGLTFKAPKLPFKFDVEGRAFYLPDAFSVAGTKPDILHYDARLKIRYIF